MKREKESKDSRNKGETEDEKTIKIDKKAYNSKKNKYGIVGILVFLIMMTAVLISNIWNQKVNLTTPRSFSKSFIQKLSEKDVKSLKKFLLSNADFDYIIENVPNEESDDVDVDELKNIRTINFEFIQKVLSYSEINWSNIKYKSYHFKNAEIVDSFNTYVDFSIQFYFGSIMYYIEFEVLVKIGDNWKIAGDCSSLYDNNSKLLIRNKNIYEKKK